MMACLLPWTLAGVVDQGLSPPDTFSSPPHPRPTSKPTLHLFTALTPALGRPGRSPPTPSGSCVYIFLAERLRRRRYANVCRFHF